MGSCCMNVSLDRLERPDCSVEDRVRLQRPSIEPWDFINGSPERKNHRPGFFVLLMMHRQRHQRNRGRWFGWS